MDGAGKPGAEEAQVPEGKGEQEYSQQKEEEEMAGAPQGLFRGGKSGELEQEEERLSKEWEDSKRWSKMDQLAKELTAEKRLEGQEEEEDNPDRSMKLSFRARAYGFRGPGPQLRQGWRPSSQEDSVEAGLPLQVRGYPEEKKEEEGSANRRPEVGMGREPARCWAAESGSSRGSHTQTHCSYPTEGTRPPGVWGWRDAQTGGSQGRRMPWLPGGIQQSWLGGGRSSDQPVATGEAPSGDFVPKAVGSLAGCALEKPRGGSGHVPSWPPGTASSQAQALHLAHEGNGAGQG